jgi:hypothetical protein
MGYSLDQSARSRTVARNHEAILVAFAAGAAVLIFTAAARAVAGDVGGHDIGVAVAQANGEPIMVGGTDATSGGSPFTVS